MRFAVEAWAPEYGSPMGDDLEPVERVDVDVEVDGRDWAPRAPALEPGETTVLFIDGVQRIDARVWIGAETSRLGICATYAAGIARCDGSAEVVRVQVERGLFSAAPEAEAIETRHARFAPRAAAGDTTEHLRMAVQQRMAALETSVALDCGAREADLVVVDGPLRHALPGAIGYVKTHHMQYLPDDLLGVVPRLEPGNRTPLFVATTSWSRYSWYVRLPGPTGHPWAGVVRCECSGDLAATDAARLADRATGLLRRFASAPHKDPRAPQNLYPIAGLERQLRRRSGDPALIYRALREAAHQVA
jgi:hypothetical protein